MRYDEISPIPPFTKAVKTFIISCVVVYLIQRLPLQRMGFLDVRFEELFGLVPMAIVQLHWYWQFVTYMFLHGPPFHLLFNLAVFWYFGAELEMRLGTWRFVRFFFFCGIGAGIFNFAISVLTDSSAVIIGSSGAVYGLLAAYGYFYAERTFLLFFLFPMKAKYFVLIIAGMELIGGIDRSDNIAHFAHLGGMLFGWAYVWFNFMRPKGGGGSGQGGKANWERDRLKKKFTLIVNEGEEQAPRRNDDGGGPPNYWN